MRRVLVVDNDPSLRGLLGLAFEDAGVEVRAAAGGDEAEEILRRGDVGALLMDVHLGGGESGPELLRRWHLCGFLPPVWLVTGTPDDDEVRMLSVPELQRVVGKPFALLDLVREVEGALEPVR